MNGKGDARRPAQVDAETVAANWARTFGRGEPKALPRRCPACGALTLYGDRVASCGGCGEPVSLTELPTPP